MTNYKDSTDIKRQHKGDQDKIKLEPEMEGKLRGIKNYFKM